MYDIRQFKPTLYLLLVLGLSGYALAATSPGTWIVSMALLTVHWVLLRGRDAVLRKLFANLITLGALVVTVWRLRVSATTPILIIGDFLVLLQLVKLYEARAHRDYAQIIVLSALLMIASAINTASLGFAVILLVYLFVALYLCLLFHLKIETDHAKAAIGIHEDKLSPTTLRQDQRFLGRSIRRLTVLSAACSISTAVAVFLFFPRSAGSSLFGSLTVRPAQSLTGFSEQVSFERIAAIQQNDEIVAYVKVWKNGAPVSGVEPLMLRGLALDVYTGRNGVGGSSAGAWQWVRSAAAASRNIGTDSYDHVFRFREPIGSTRIRQEIMLLPNGSRVIFALPGVTQFRSTQIESRLDYSSRDQCLQSIDPVTQQLRYEIISDGHLVDVAGGRGPGVFDLSGADDESPLMQMLRPRRPPIDPQIEAYARSADVSGRDEQGPLAPRRDRSARVTPLDSQIAAAIEAHLRSSQFSYTLDLTDTARVGDRDPMVAFLYDFKRGHCEYFAGAMTLMCQSLGLQARMIVGFKCDDHNSPSDAYIVRQNHAHAWVEVLGENGEWRTYDPTNGRDTPQPGAVAAAWKRARQWFDYLEYSWANSVVAYDRGSRTNVITNVATKLNEGSDVTQRAAKTVRDWFRYENFIWFSSTVLSSLIWLLVGAIVFLVLWYALERMRLRRLARRIGLNTLPREEQLKLARQLGFYDLLLRSLEKRGIRRMLHLTPMEFSSTLSFLPADLYDTIKRLTEILYRVRYGREQLTAGQQRHLFNAVNQIESVLRVP